MIANGHYYRSPLIRNPGASTSYSSSRSVSTPKGGSTPSSSITDNLLSVSFPSPFGSIRGGGGEKTLTPSHKRSNDKDDKKRPTAGDFF